MIWRQILDPANQYADRNEPWKLVKTDKAAAKKRAVHLVEPLRQAAILLKPFLPRSAEMIYRSFNFKQPWEQCAMRMRGSIRGRRRICGCWRRWRMAR